MTMSPEHWHVAPLLSRGPVLMWASCDATDSYPALTLNEK